MRLVGRRWDGGGIGIRCPKSEGYHVLRNRRTPINCKSKQNKQRRLQGIKKISSIEESHERKIRNGITQFGRVVLTPRLRDGSFRRRDFSPVRTGRRRVASRVTFMRDVALQRSEVRPGATVEDQVSDIIGQVGPSMLLTSLSESVAFFIGQSPPHPSLSPSPSPSARCPSPSPHVHWSPRHRGPSGEFSLYFKFYS